MLIVSMQICSRKTEMKKYTKMKKILVILSLLTLFVFNIQSQSKTTSSYITDKDNILVDVNVKTTDVRLPITDINGIYKKIGEMEERDSLKYAILSGLISNINENMNDLKFNQSEVKLSFIASKFGITKEDIKLTIKRENYNMAISLIFPLLLILLIWKRLWFYKSYKAESAAVYIALTLIVGFVSYVVLNFMLNSIFNPNLLILNKVKDLL